MRIGVRSAPDRALEGIISGCGLDTVLETEISVWHLSSRPRLAPEPVRIVSSRIDPKGYAGYSVVEALSQTLWREDPLAVAQRCHAGAMKVLAAA